MSLRPRYSLLTLLILTALVAGGVKLWYGPYHVVEETKAGEEVEYTYTRNWRGGRSLQGPCVIRCFNQDATIEYIEIRYYRSGEELPWVYTMNSIADDSRLNIPAFHGPHHNLPFQQNELDEFEEAIRIASLWKLAAGQRRSEYIGFNFFNSPFDRGVLARPR